MARKRNISPWRRSMKTENHKRTTHKDSFVKATNILTGEVKFFKNGVDASIRIGCSRALAYSVLKKKCERAHGWTLEYIPKDATECAGFKKEVEDRIQSQRKAIVDMIKGRVRERKQLIQDAKKLRKAEHDEIVGTLNAAMETIRG